MSGFLAMATPNWFELPTDPIEKILACLDVFDLMNFSSTCKTWEMKCANLQLNSFMSGSTHELYEPMFLYVHHFTILCSQWWMLDLHHSIFCISCLTLVSFCWTTHRHLYIADIKTKSRWHKGWGKLVRRHGWATRCVCRKIIPLHEQAVEK